MIGANICAVLAVAIVSVQGQDFCRGYQCPGFTVAQSANGYEVRDYEASNWVGVAQYTNAADSDTNGMFMKLFNYIGGANADGVKIPMTVPVITKVESMSGGKYRHTMMFYLDGANPAPTAADVQLYSMPAKRVYVKGFHKWFSFASPSEFASQAEDLREAIGTSGSYNTMTFYKAGYASPWWPIKKYHEVWLDSA